VPFLLKFVFPDASFLAWKDSIAFFLLIAVLLVKPTGLFGERGE
jgi:branched-subunit amino acid ABC-type transport system permease component